MLKKQGCANNRKTSYDKNICKNVNSSLDLKILSLNCCGIMTRMQYPEFIELIKCYDFICLTETKTDDFDNVDIPGYTFKLKNRKTKSKVKSGGIAFGYKNELENYVQTIETESNLVFWVKISANYLKTEQDVMIGTVYIPPENSTYKVPDSINIIEQEFLNFSANHESILLTGDFNSRTAANLDFYEITNTNHDTSDNFNIDFSNNLHKFHMSRFRNSCDKTKNHYGNLLLEMCRNNNLFILNGRVEGDKEGLFTCRQSSVVDYFICTYNLLSCVVNMSVLDFSALFSDVHSPLNCKLVFNSIDNIVECDDILINDFTCHERKGFKKWDCEKEAEFLRNIDRNKIDQLNNDLTMLNTSILAQENINKIVESVNGLMLDSAEKVFGSFTYKRHEKKCRKKVIKPWISEQAV
ncbi:unnamed protein product [Mytilus edulis]|uniref:Endonuclease/exonuclease/phosphatase domain-containing protein n=1 Tax=Mytilus edulis TaxID=6550 RepID=A0A8S3V0D4_MYTED|nr:unnamed protein product [Mytilus edulis]